MALRCPNKNTEEYKTLVSELGETRAYKVFIANDYSLPDMATVNSIIQKLKSEVQYNMKAVAILFTDKANQWFKKRDKFNWTGDLFYSKLSSELQIPKEQVEILKSLDVKNPYNREELLTSLLASYSYTIEINTTKGYGGQYGPEEYSFEKDGWTYTYVPQYDRYTKFNNTELQEIGSSKEEYEQIKNHVEAQKGIPNTQFYSNLTVPGGTNGSYTENNINTPGIVPSIRGHAQFSEDSSVGWFRSDDKNTFIGFKEDLIKKGLIKQVPC